MGSENTGKGTASASGHSGSTSRAAQEATVHELKLTSVPELIGLARSMLASDDWHRLSAAGFRPCVAFDADGTLWRGDLSEALVAEVLRSGGVKEEGLAAINHLLRALGEAEAADAPGAMDRLGEAYQSGRLFTTGERRGWTRAQVEETLWPSMNLLFAGWESLEVRRLAARVWEAGFSQRVFPELRALLEGLRGLGLKTVVVSAGLDPAVAMASERLGFSPAEVRGQRSVEVEGRMQGTVIPPVMYGPGKVATAQTLCGGAPLMALGDSSGGSDQAMLEAAYFPVAVRPVGRHREAARLRGFRVLEGEVKP